MRRVCACAVALVLAVAGLALACARRPGAPPPQTSFAWRDCGGDFRCATVRVPVDHAVPSGDALDLSVALLPAEKPAERLGVLVVNPGGPGISAVSYLRSSWLRLGTVLHQRFDLVAFDTRGTGDSAPLDCHESFARLMAQDPAPEGDAPWQSAVDAARALAEECRAKHGARLAFMSSADNAFDLDWVRAALGEEKISYLGFSYGTALGASYSSLYPERIRAVVLDGSIDPSFELERFTREQSAAVEGALTAWNAEGRRKGWVGTDALDAVYAQAPRRSAVLYAAAEGLASPPEGWRTLAGAVGLAQTGDWAGIDELYQRYFGGLSVEAHLAALCADLVRPGPPEAYRAALPAAVAASPHFGAGNLLAHLPCAFWPEAKHRPPAEPRGATPPMLVLANRDDPLTPHVWGERLAARFASATRVDVESREHTAFGRGDPCVDSLVEGYLVAPAPPVRTHCP